MSNLEIIEKQCAIIDAQNRLIKKLSAKLLELGALEEAERKAGEEIGREWEAVLGAEEVPDELEREE